MKWNEIGRRFSTRLLTLQYTLYYYSIRVVSARKSCKKVREAIL